ncbi:hypothetical protein BHM03_00014809 [Ensete ventricosum]|nr:hypothetical protein BHM03_00014809 [Ensete ventricosum]
MHCPLGPSRFLWTHTMRVLYVNSGMVASYRHVGGVKIFPIRKLPNNKISVTCLPCCGDPHLLHSNRSGIDVDGESYIVVLAQLSLVRVRKVVHVDIVNLKDLRGLLCVPTTTRIALLPTREEPTEAPKFARRFVEEIGKLTRNTLGDYRNKTARLTARMPEAVGLAGWFNQHCQGFQAVELPKKGG